MNRPQRLRLYPTRKPYPWKRETARQRCRLLMAAETLEKRQVFASLSGVVYLDADNDSVLDANESGIPGVVITLSGTSATNEEVSKTAITLNDGTYRFPDLAAGTYTLAETQPAPFSDGGESTPASGATVTNDRLANLVLTATTDLANNLFAERNLAAEYHSITWFFASSATQPGQVLRSLVATAEEKAGHKELAASIRAGATQLPDGINQAPVAVADTYDVGRGVTLTTTAANGVLKNDTDADNDTLRAILGTTTTNGTLTLNGDGSFTYVPVATFSGTDTFTYRVNDGTVDSANVTVTLNVATPNTFSLAENTVAGTVVGRLTVSNDVATTRVFDVDTASKPNELILRPDDHRTGPTDAKLVLIEYFSLQCPVCATYHPSVRALETQFKDDLLIVRRHLTLASTTFPNADIAAQAAEAAGRQNKFDEMVNLLFEKQTEWSGMSDAQARTQFEAYATQLSLTLTQFKTDFADPAIAARIKRDEDAAAVLTATATPTFFLNGVKLTNPTTDQFDEVIQTALDDFDEPFIVDRTTGDVIVTAAGLNFESTNTFNFTAIVTDNDTTRETLNVRVNLTDVNEVPVGVADTYTIARGGTLTVTTANGVLKNDTDQDAGDAATLTAAVVANPTNGTVTLDPSGSFTYTPNATFTGTDTFTYRANDGTLNSANTTVTITVTATTNQAPVAVADSYAVDEDAPLTVTAVAGVLNNDTDAESNPISAQVQTTTSHGTLNLNSDGSFTYTPMPNFNGSDSFTYRATDGTTPSATVTVSITVRPINDAPVAEADTYDVLFNTPLVVNTVATGLVKNDTDADTGTTLTASIVDQPAHGTIQLQPNGTFTFTPTTDFRGLDQFTYRVNDGTVNSNTATVQLKIGTAGNVAPTAVADTYRTTVNTTLNVTAAEGVLKNDTDDRTKTELKVTLTTPNAQHGTVMMNMDGSFSYVPTTGYRGLDTFTYLVTDSIGATDTETVTITVNADPVGVADSFSVAEDGTLQVNASQGVLKNDTDADTTQTLTATLGTNVTHGTLQLNADGSFTYMPTANFNGSDSFTYTVSDGIATSSAVTVTLTVTAVADPVTANNDRYRITGTTVTTTAETGVLKNDLNPDNRTITVVQGTGPTQGTLTLNPNGSFVYTPTGTVTSDSFTYTIKDGETTSAPATVTLAVNAAPTTVADTYSIAEDGTLTIAVPQGVLANDTDSDSDPLTATVAQTTANGTLTLNANGSFTYVPIANFSGTDSFTYVANDGVGDSTTTSVTITVTPVNDPPVTVNDTYSVNKGTTLTVPVINGVLANDDEVDDQTLTVTLTTPPTSGELTLQSNGSFTYTPSANPPASVTFVYTASDGTLTTTGTVTITITMTNNRPPVAVADTYTTNEDITLVVGLSDGVLKNDSDPDGTVNLTATVVADVEHGTLTLSGDGTFTYVPDPQYFGPDSFTYRVSDGTTDSNVVSVNLTITAVNDPPVGVNDSYSTNQDTNLVVVAADGVLKNDTDPDGGLVTRAIILSDVLHGVISLAPSGSFTYIPTTGYSGTDSFTYQAEDAQGNASSPVTVTLTIISTDPENAPPVAVADSYTTNFNSSLTVNAAQGVLANDTDVDGDTLTATVVDLPEHGNVTMLTTGGFLYQPQASFAGTDSFTYRASDGTAESSLTTVEITVRAANTFSVLSNAAVGTAVGTVTPSSSMGSTRRFDFLDASLPPELRLVTDDHLSGDLDAPVVLVEYLDLQCPVCKEYHPIVRQLEQDFQGELLVVRRHFPLTTVHPHARVAARAAEAAGRQGKFDEMVDKLFELQTTWGPLTDPQSEFESYATSLGLDLDQFRIDAALPEVDQRITRDFDAVIGLGGAGTPTFFLEGAKITNPTSSAQFDGLIQSAVEDVNDLFRLNRQTGVIEVRDATALATAGGSQALSITAVDAAGNRETITVNVSIVSTANGESDSSRLTDAAITEESDWIDLV